jgi:hypothetical protein
VSWKAHTGFRRGMNSAPEEGGWTQPGCRTIPNIIAVQISNRSIFARRVSVRNGIAQIYPYDSSKAHSASISSITAMHWYPSYCLR